MKVEIDRPTDTSDDDAWQDKRLGLLNERISQVVVRSRALNDQRKIRLAFYLEMTANTLRSTVLQNASASARAAEKTSRYEEVRGGLVEPVAPPRDV